jgi:hypothetical protein
MVYDWDKMNLIGQTKPKDVAFELLQMAQSILEFAGHRTGPDTGGITTLNALGLTLFQIAHPDEFQRHLAGFIISPNYDPRHSAYYTTISFVANTLKDVLGRPVEFRNELNELKSYIEALMKLK